MSNWYDNLDDAIDAGAVKTDGDVKRDFDVMEFAAGLARSIGQGITFGTADEAEGFVRSILGDQTYKQARDQVRKELEQFRSDYPKTAYGSEIASSIAMPMGVAGLAGRGIAKGGQRFAPELTEAIRQTAAKAGQKIATAAPRTTAALTSKPAKAAGMSAAYGAGAAEEMSDVPQSMVAAGALGYGLQRAAPAVTAGAAELIKKGVPLTVGQKFGGIAGGIEERLAGLPVADFLIGGARRRAVTGFERAAYDEALAPLGQKLPKGVKGRDAYIKAKGIINKAYDDVLKDINIPSPNQIISQIPDVAATLPKKEAGLYSRIIMKELGDRVVDGRLTGTAFKESQSELRKRAYKFMTSNDAYQRELGEALSDAAEELTTTLGKFNPDKASRLANIDMAYSRFKPMEMAASAKGMAGEVTPAKLLEKVYAQSRRAPSVLARGGARMQELAETGADVIGTKVPDSGTVGRLALAMGTLGGGAAIDPVTTGLVAGGTGAVYSPFGQAVLGGARKFGRDIPGIMQGVGATMRAPVAGGLLSQELPRVDITESLPFQRRMGQ
jgi:hypothetical protein